MNEEWRLKPAPLLWAVFVIAFSSMSLPIVLVKVDTSYIDSVRYKI